MFFACFFNSALKLIRISWVESSSFLYSFNFDSNSSIFFSEDKSMILEDIDFLFFSKSSIFLSLFFFSSLSSFSFYGIFGDNVFIFFMFFTLVSSVFILSFEMIFPNKFRINWLFEPSFCSFCIFNISKICS